MGEQRFPIQGFPLGVPWSAAERAYETYAGRCGKEQSLARLAERGGFGLYEFAFLYLGQHPRNNATASARERTIGEALSIALAGDGERGDMKEEEIVERAKDLLREQLGVEDRELVPDAKFYKDLGADSLDILEIILAVEKEFDIDICDEDAEKLLTFGDLTEYLTKRLTSDG